VYTSHSIIRVIRSRMMRWAGHVAQSNAIFINILAGKPDRKRLLGRPRRRRMYNRVRRCRADASASGRDQWRVVVNMVMNLRFP
jgi:hypothetical protein